MLMNKFPAKIVYNFLPEKYLKVFSVSATKNGLPYGIYHALAKVSYLISPKRITIFVILRNYYEPV